MRKLLAIWAGKLLITAGKLLGKKTTSAPGEYALKICPKLITNLNKHVQKGVIVVCGTNGKTTTNNLMCSVLEAKGYKVMCNRLGANMISGVATAFLQESNIFGKFKVDYACFEIDEAYARIVFDYVKPDVMILTNLFRDQLDRYGEIDTTTKIIKEAIDKVPDIKLILNGDDPLGVQFGNEASIYYGISEQVLDQTNESKEGKFCPVCGTQLEYNYHHYSQLGDFSCPSCGFKRPRINIEVKDVSLKAPMKFTVNGQQIQTDNKGFYNIYNMIAIYGALTALGESTDNFSKLLCAYKPQIGRMQEFKFKNKTIILNLSKNPAGFNQAIATVNTDDRKKDVIIAVNDRVSDGRDISWLWDVEFEKLENVNELILSGQRMYDLGLRFKYADINANLITADIKEAFTKALATDSEVVYAIVNYTVMFPAEEILKNLLKEFGE